MGQKTLHSGIKFGPVVIRNQRLDCLANAITGALDENKEADEDTIDREIGRRFFGIKGHDLSIENHVGNPHCRIGEEGGEAADDDGPTLVERVFEMNPLQGVFLADEVASHVFWDLSRGADGDDGVFGERGANAAGEGTHRVGGFVLGVFSPAGAAVPRVGVSCLIVMERAAIRADDAGEFSHDEAFFQISRVTDRHFINNKIL